MERDYMQGCVAGAEDTVYAPCKVSDLMDHLYVRVKTIKGKETKGETFIHLAM